MVDDLPDSRATSQQSRGTDSKQLSRSSAATTQTSEPYSETAKIPVLAKPAKKTNSIEFDQRNLAIGTARYRGATHLSKNVALKPHADGVGADLMNHLNVEVHLYDDTGKEVPMTERYIRDWTFDVKDPKTRIATLKLSDLKLSDVLPRFRRDFPSTTDAPGMQNLVQGQKTRVDLQEFIAGNPKVGGFYFQNVAELDPDGTTRIIVANKIPLTPDDFKTLTKVIIPDRNFEMDYAGKFIIGNLPNTIDSDSGLDRSLPENVEKKRQSQQSNRMHSQ
jgi:hypothetical protein